MTSARGTPSTAVASRWRSSTGTAPSRSSRSPTWPLRPGPSFPWRPPSQLAQAGFDPLPDLPARLRLFVDAYGLADRASILPAVERSPLASAEVIRYYPVDASARPDSLEFLARQLRWIHSLVPDLARAL